MVTTQEKTQVQENFYDAEELRYAVKENGKYTGFVTNGWYVFNEVDEEWNGLKRLVRGNGIIASEDGPDGYHYYHRNEHGDTKLITGADGQIQNAYSYDVFGKIRTSRELIENRYTYYGEQYDKVSEQYYLRARYYNPAIARFTQEDEYRGDGLNLYAYCANNPVMYVDPSGYNVVKCIVDSTKAKKNNAEANNQNNSKQSGEGGSKTSDEVYAGVREASEYLKSQGVPRQYRKQILESFDVRTIKMEVAGDNTFGLRFYGGNAQAKGRYLFETFTPLTNRNNLALPYEWNSMTGIQQFQVKSGTTMITGRASAQTSFGSQYVGGAKQWYINDLEDLIP